jgi:hypothetical protein
VSPPSPSGLVNEKEHHDGHEARGLGGSLRPGQAGAASCGLSVDLGLAPSPQPEGQPETAARAQVAAVTGSDSEYQPQLILRAGPLEGPDPRKGDGARRGAARARPSSLSST